MIVQKINAYNSAIRPQTKSLLPTFKQVHASTIKKIAPKDALIEKLIYSYVNKMKKSSFSQNPEVRKAEEKLAELGINTRFHNDKKLAEYALGAIECLQKHNIEVPHNIIFTSPFWVKTGISIWSRTFPQKEAPIILSNKIYENTPNNKNLSSNHPYHTFFHETGHWLHFNNGLNIQKNYKTWQKYANPERIANIVSKRAIDLEDGSEFCAEVFAGIMSGKDFPNDILLLLEKLNFPKIL